MASRVSGDELCRRIDESFVDAFSTLCTASPGALLKNEGDMILYSSGYPNSLLNGVLGPRFTSGNMARRTEDALAFFKKRGLPMTFYVGPCCTPAELDEHLQRRGLAPGWARPGMAIDLESVARVPAPEGMRIVEVADKKTMETCSMTFAKGFTSGEDARNWLCELARGYGFGPTRTWFLGMLDGRPVSTSLLVQHRGIAGVYCVATVEDARGRGAGSALTREALLKAKDLGYDVAVLQSSKLGLPVYEKLGFKEHCKIRAYSWPAK